jgi:hypothetical protein
MCQTGRICYILYIGKWLRIGVGDARTMMLQTKTNHLFGCEVIMPHIRRHHLGDLMVLTIQTMKVTTCTSD